MKVMTVQEKQSGLFPEGSDEDLRLRGFGGRGRRVPQWPDGSAVDRKLYLVTYVKTRCSDDDINRALEGVRSGAMRGEVLIMLGISERLSPRVMGLTALFTNLGLGSEYAQCVKDKIARTNIARYGGVSPMSSREVKERIKRTNLDRYGVENASSSPEIKERRRRTVRDRYGVDYTLSDPGIRERRQQTIRAVYGVDNISQSEVIKDRKREASMRRYGVPCTALDPDVRRRQLETLRRNHPDLPADAQGPFEAPSVQATARASHLARYGVENPFAREDVKERLRQTLIQRYGVDNPIKSAEIRARVNRTKRKNGTFNTSSPEDQLYELLCEYANQHDMTVVRQYRDKKRYPFPADFYIPERDLFIELNGSWVHGGHWYDAGCEMDQSLVRAWLKKGEQSKYYRKAVKTWTQRDVLKRQTARKAGLNYVVLWDGFETLSDAHLWLDSGAPDGHDWEQEYSWLD